MRKGLAVVNLAGALFACLLAFVAAPAQTPPQQQLATAAAAPVRLIVQVESLKGARPSYQTVPGGSWYSRFGWVGRPQSRTDAVEGPLAVGVETRLVEGGRVEIAVGVHMGVTRFDRFEEAGKLYAAAGETVTADGLERFGVAPFGFRVLRVADAAAAPPEVVNLTQSVEASVTEFTPTPLPRGKLTLRNLSSRRVRAVFVKTYNGGAPSTGFATLRQGRTLMEPGGTAERPFVTTDGQTANAADFAPTAVEKIVVASVVFDDYTYEGEAEPAATLRAFAEGERVQLPRLLRLLSEAQAAADAESPDAPRRLREKISALGREAPAGAVEAALRAHPEAGPKVREGVRIAVESSMHSSRRGLLDDLDRFEKRPRAEPADGGFGRWLGETRARLEAWLARL